MLAGNYLWQAEELVDVESVNRLRVTIGRLARRLNVNSTREGLTPTEASILGLAVKLGPVALPELVELEGIHPSMLSRVVGRLVTLGLITREFLPADARSVIVDSTPAGAAKHSRIKSDRADVVSKCVSELTAEQVNALEVALPALEALAEHLQSIPRASA